MPETGGSQSAREARDIEWLVNWALAKQRADRADVGSIISPGAVRSQLGGLGVKVDGGNRHGTVRAVHADAETIWLALNAMWSERRVTDAVGLVVQHGRLGTQPDWGHCQLGRYVLERKNGGEGKAVKRYRDQKNGRDLLGWEWKWVGHTLEGLELMMMEWMAWRAALVDLREEVNPRLRTYVATGPAVAAEPWDDPVFIKATAVLDRDEVHVVEA